MTSAVLIMKYTEKTAQEGNWDYFNKYFLTWHYVPYTIYIADTLRCHKKFNIGASPSGKAAGFGPAIPEVRILPPQNKKRPANAGFFYSMWRWMRTVGENRASELRLECFCLKWYNHWKQNTKLPLHANEQDPLSENMTFSHIFLGRVPQPIKTLRGLFYFYN